MVVCSVVSARKSTLGQQALHESKWSKQLVAIGSWTLERVRLATAVDPELASGDKLYCQRTLPRRLVFLVALARYKCLDDSLIAIGVLLQLLYFGSQFVLRFPSFLIVNASFIGIRAIQAGSMNSWMNIYTTVITPGWMGDLQ